MSQKPVWLTLAEQLVTQAQRDINKSKAKELRNKQQKHALFGLEKRARLKTNQEHQEHQEHHA